MGDKCLIPDFHGDGRLLIFIRRIENRQEPAHHKVVNPPFIDGHMRKLHELLRRDDGVMVRHLFIVHEKRLFRDWKPDQPAADGAVGADGAGLQPLL